MARQERVEVPEKRPCGEALLQFIEGNLSIICPYKRSTFLTFLGTFGEVKKSSSYLGVGIDEPSVEVCKTQKRLNFFDVSGHWPLKDGGNLPRFHFNPIGAYHETEEGDFVCHELALAGLAKQLSAAKAL